jgi:hypothetical protein
MQGGLGSHTTGYRHGRRVLQDDEPFQREIDDDDEFSRRPGIRCLRNIPSQRALLVPEARTPLDTREIRRMFARMMADEASVPCNERTRDQFRVHCQSPIGSDKLPVAERAFFRPTLVAGGKACGESKESPRLLAVLLAQKPDRPNCWYCC